MSVDLSQLGGEISSNRPEVLLRALLVCDLADSTALVERLGDREAAELIRRHDQFARDLMQRHGGREIDKTDGFLILFERPVEAVAFALDLQRALRRLSEDSGQPLDARTGIHVGEIVAWSNAPVDVARGAKALEVEGLAKSTAARLMALAAPGQILLSEVACALARRGAGELAAQGELRWSAHGRYRFKGIAEAISVHEVSEAGAAHARRPHDTAKARRRKTAWKSPIVLGLAGLTLVVAVVVAAFLFYSKPVLALGERDWVVVGDVVNLNADKRLEAVLSSAFRIGLEQSRFVHVIPEAQVRQALERMQRARESPIDRELASEIALQEQATAVLLPSVTQYGSTLRISVEIVDPQRQRTMGAQSSDANGPDQVLRALDRLLKGLRGTLGESMAQVQLTTQPLEQVSTPNLEALRAYSQAGQLARQGDFGQAEAALDHATELDPKFAAAHAFRASVLYSQERWPQARRALEQALSIDGRLTERTRIYSRALLAHFTDPRVALSLWQTYSTLYPDYPQGAHNVGNICYMFLHDLACAEAGLRKAALVPKSPLRNYTLDTLGDVLVAADKPEEAIGQYRKAIALSPAPGTFGWTSALIAVGKLDDAERQLNEAAHQPPHIEVEREMRRATLLVARGELGAAVSTLAMALSDAEHLDSPNARWRARAALIALHSGSGATPAARELATRHLAELTSAAAMPEPGIGTIEQLAYASAWAARLGLTDPARQALALARQVGALDRFPVRLQLAELAQAELDLLADPAGVAARLAPSAEAPELWEIHELRARAFRRAGDVTGEAGELRWLLARRGLAQTQWTDQWLGQQARQLALLDAASRLTGLGSAR